MKSSNPSDLRLLGAADEHFLPVVGGDREEGGVGEDLGSQEVVAGSTIAMEDHGGGGEVDL